MNCFSRVGIWLITIKIVSSFNCYFLKNFRAVVLNINSAVFIININEALIRVKDYLFLWNIAEVSLDLLLIHCIQGMLKP